MHVMWAIQCLFGWIGSFPRCVTHEADTRVDLTDDLWPRAVHCWLHCVPKSSAAKCERIGSSRAVCPVGSKVNTCRLTPLFFTEVGVSTGQCQVCTSWQYFSQQWLIWAWTWDVRVAWCSWCHFVWVFLKLWALLCLRGWFVLKAADSTFPFCHRKTTLTFYHAFIQFWLLFKWILF